MGILIGALLAILSLTVLLAPFFRAGQRRGLSQATQNLEDVMAKRQRVYQEMQALQLDYQLGNIEEEEYRTLMRGRRLEAASLMQRQKEEEEKLEGLSQEVEEAILAFRKSVAGWQEEFNCTQCGSPLSSQTSLCPQCGASLETRVPPPSGDRVP